jgi:Zn-dependent protease
MNFKLVTFFGIPLKLNVFTLLFIIYIYLTNSNELIEGTPLQMDLFATVIFCVMLFFVILHEYGHCLMAKKLGWRVNDITIYPIGGIARMEFNVSSSKEEILVTAAGPAVNLVFGVLFAIATVAAFFIDQDAVMVILILFTLTIINLSLVAFNILLIYPMDGGRLLRAVLSYKMGHERATWWAVKIGQLLGTFLIFAAIYYEFYLTAGLLVFILINSQKEITNARIVDGLMNIRRKSAIILNKPELETVSLPEFISCLELIEDEEIKKTLKLDELLPILRCFHEDDITI